MLDAAGGSTGQYIHAAREYTGFDLHGYIQDPQLDGKQGEGTTFIGGLIDAVPMPDQSFDAISCHHSIEHFRGDLDIRFVKELARLLKPGGRAAITPLFLGNVAVDIWNRKPALAKDPQADLQIIDRFGAFCGWGPFEGYARVYSPATFKQRLLDALPADCSAAIYRVLLDGKPAPDMKHNNFQPAINGEMKALLITRN